MHGSWKKSLVAGALCWLLLACGALDRAEGAEQQLTADDIIRSIVVVRAKLGSVWQNSFGLSTGQQSRAQPVEPFHQGANRRGPPLSITFRSIIQTQPPVVTFSVTPTFAGRAATTQSPIVATTSGPAENNVPSPMLLDVGSASPDSLARSAPTAPPPAESREAVRANPLGIIFPTQEQLNNFNGGWQRPYQGQDGSAISTSTTGPSGGDFVFPQDEDENLYGIGGQGPPWHQATSTTTVASSENSMRVGSSSENPLMTVDPLEQETTEPPEEGLGNRIDQKVLISLLG